MQQQVSVNRNIKHDCECGGKYTDKHSARHNKTKQHREYHGLPPIGKDVNVVMKKDCILTTFLTRG
jgi:hypothetical protein